MGNFDVTTFISRKFGTKNSNIREFLAEFLGTFILVLFGDGAVAQMVLGGTSNDYFSVIVGYSVAVVLAILVVGGISGAHINPAVTFALAVFGKLPWNKVPFYMVGQYLGAFAASGVLYYEYADALDKYEGKPSLTTAGIWATYPGSVTNDDGSVVEYLSAANGFGDQVLGTALLLIIVSAVNDENNLQIPKCFAPLFVGLGVMNIGLSFGMNCGFAINPARDLPPRIFTFIAGWGEIPFSTATVDEIAWWWIPVVATHLGAILGIAIYTLLIQMHQQSDDEVLFIKAESIENGNSDPYKHDSPQLNDY